MTGSMVSSNTNHKSVIKDSRNSIVTIRRKDKITRNLSQNPQLKPSIQGYSTRNDVGGLKFAKTEIEVQ